MAKRGAGDQLTRENYRNNSDEEDNNKDASNIASSAVMNRRKIAMPKRKMAFSNKITNDSNSNKAESTFASAFNFAKKDVTKQGDTSVIEKNSKLKALNEQFRDKIIDLVKLNPCADLASVFDKYKCYMKDIAGTTTDELKSKAIPTTSVKTTIPKPSIGFNFPKGNTKNAPAPTLFTALKDAEKKNDQNGKSSSSSSSSSEDEDQEIKVEGPSFTISTKPITSDSVFSFGKKKTVQKNDSDSESDIEIKGPQFTFSGSVKSDIFKLKPKVNESIKQNDIEKKPFSTNKPGSQESNEAGNKQKPLFSFNAKPSVENSENSTSKPSFSFGNKKDQDTETVASKSETETQKPSSSFSFNIGKKPTDPTKEKPSFSFGQPNSSMTTEKKDDKEPSFNFGQTQSSDGKNEAAKPAFTFGQATITSEKKDETKPVFTFGQTTSTSENKEETKPSFTFGQTTSTSENKEETKPSFTFGQTTYTSEKKDETKPSFSFGQAVNENDKTVESKPSFAFGNTTSTIGKDDADKTKFNFNMTSSSTEQTKTSESRPAFTFNTTSSAAAATPSFSFGNNSNSNTSAAPSEGFKFSLPFGQKTISTKTDQKTSEEKPATTTTSAETNTTTGDETQATEEQSKPVDMQNGEEDEDVLFTQRAKLMIFNSETKSYDSRGVGEMKLLQKKEDKSKIRLLCRSDGMGNILLNTSVVKSFTYSPLTEENENLVKTPTVDSDGKLITYIVRFKQKADGRAFIKAIEDAKSDLA